MSLPDDLISAQPPQIREVLAADAPALQRLRNWYIDNSVTSFDEQPLSMADVHAWMDLVATRPYRLLVAEQDGELLGYCCSQPYRPHPAFVRTVETSIYVQPGLGRKGIGSALYGALQSTLAEAGYHPAMVGIALPNPASIRLHEKQGFRLVGVFDEYSCKGRHRLSSQWMESVLG